MLIDEYIVNAIRKLEFMQLGLISFN